MTTIGRRHPFVNETCRKTFGFGSDAEVTREPIEEAFATLNSGHARIQTWLSYRMGIRNREI
jgi:hypothetical protein